MQLNIIKMTFCLHKKILIIVAIAMIMLIILITQIIIAKKCSSQTVALMLRIDFITLIQLVMCLLSRRIWKTMIYLMETFEYHNKSNTISGNRPESNRESLRKWKNSESDLSTLVAEHEQSLATTVGKVVLFIYLGLCHLSYLTNIFLLNTEPHWFSVIAYVCFGTYIQLITGWIILKLLSLVVYVFAKLNKSTYRPVFLCKRNIVIFALIYSIVASTYGLYTASQPPNVKHVAIALKDLSLDLEGFQIIQLSDIHLGPTVGLSKMKKIVEIVNEQNPDIVVVTGDLVDGSVKKLKLAADPLRAVHSKHGNFFVSGNHEYYTGDVDNWFMYLNSLGFHVLHNSNVRVPSTVINGHGQICIAGTDDIQADRIGYAGHKFDLDKALSTCNKGEPVILLAHQPYAAKLALDSQHRLDLVLSGHTHGGQMFPMIIGAYFLNPFFAGLYQYGEKGNFVYVSQGTQFWGIPMRIGTSMEITRITLHKAVY